MKHDIVLSSFVEIFIAMISTMSILTGIKYFKMYWDQTPSCSKHLRCLGPQGNGFLDWETILCRSSYNKCLFLVRLDNKKRKILQYVLEKKILQYLLRIEIIKYLLICISKMHYLFLESSQKCFLKIRTANKISNNIYSSPKLLYNLIAGGSMWKR